MKVYGNTYTTQYQSNDSKKISIFAHMEKYYSVAQNSSKPQQILIFFMLTFFREQCTSFPL